MDWKVFKHSIETLIFECRNTTTCYKQYASIRQVVAKINEYLLTIKDKMKTIDGSDIKINCFYELKVNFLFDCPSTRGKLFKNGSKCNNIEVLLFLVKGDETQQRFLIGCYSQYQYGQISTLTVNRIPKFEKDFVADANNESENNAKRQMTANDFNAEYFSNAKAASILFTVMVIIMLMIQRDMEVSKFHVGTHLLCVPYEQIDVLIKKWKVPPETPGMMYTYNDNEVKKYDEQVKMARNEILNLARGETNGKAVIHASAANHDARTTLYINEALSRLTESLETFKRTMDERGLSINLFKFKVCQVCALQAPL